ncbi:hypothetical protein L218DRAFT_357269 [Marasmius fiardii PR-910]|nr:hypothetical protein L218DRAFT_357269 [Marasmius fiardii PR-910]
MLGLGQVTVLSPRPATPEVEKNRWVTMSNANSSSSSFLLPPRSDLHKIVYAIALSFLSLPILLTLLCLTNPRSRKYLDRVSFRLGIVAFSCILVLVIAALIQAISGVRCDVLAGIVLFFNQFTSALLFCIGLNLVLVMIYGKNGNRLEKFYYAGSVMFSLLPTLSPVLAGEFRPDRTTSACTSVTADKSEYLGWWLSTIIILPSLVVIGELVTFAMVMIHLWKLKVLDREFMQRQKRTWITSTRMTAVISVPSPDPHTQRTQPPPLNSLSSSSSPRTKESKNKYRWIVFRISLYPLVSVITITLFIVGRRTFHYQYPGQQTLHWETPLFEAIVIMRVISHSFLILVDPALMRATSVFFGSLRRSLPFRRFPKNEHPEQRRSRSGNRRTQDYPMDISFASFGSVEYVHNKDLEANSAGGNGSDNGGNVDVQNFHSHPYPAIPVALSSPPPVHAVSPSSPRGVENFDFDLEGDRLPYSGFVEEREGDTGEHNEEVWRQI